MHPQPSRPDRPESRSRQSNSTATQDPSLLSADPNTTLHATVDDLALLARKHIDAMHALEPTSTAAAFAHECMAVELARVVGMLSPASMGMPPCFAAGRRLTQGWALGREQHVEFA